MIDINLTAAWNTVRATVPRVLDTGQGEEIVFTTSVLGLKGMPNVTHHTAAKHGMTGLMRALAIELAPHRVRVNAVVPTQTLTPMIDIPADYRALRLDLDAPTQADFAEVSLLTRTYPEPLGAPGGHHGGGLVARVGRGSICHRDQHTGGLWSSPQVKTVTPQRRDAAAPLLV